MFNPMESANTAPQTTSEPASEAIPINPHTGKPDRGLLYWGDKAWRGGRVAWTPTDEHLEEVFEAAKKGLNMKTMAAYLGMSKQTWENKRKEFPELEEVIAAGRAAGACEVIDITWAAAKDKLDNARNQELARLHRIFKTDQPDEGNTEAEQVYTGFDAIIIKKKPDANTSEG